VDVFELAKLRGTTIYGLRELMNERDARALREKEQQMKTG